MFKAVLILIDKHWDIQVTRPERSLILMILFILININHTYINSLYFCL